ncbi:MAG: SGNH/GDSL hydrolase family protein [Planctomycetes bacterium]|nr:SGNH/GDSL hydrolase family protein [Planctomycetota bacterium]
MFWQDWLKTVSSNFGSPGPQRANRTKTSCRLHVEVLEDRAVPTASLRLAVMGDSLSASYAGFPGRSGDQSWTQQLQQLRPHQVQIFNEAVSGATSGDVLSVQAGAVAGLVAAGKVDYATLIVGANDLATELNADLPILFGGNAPLFYQTFVQHYTTSVVSNIEHTVAMVSSAGDVGLAVGNIPDVAVTPAYASTTPAFILSTITAAELSANQQIASFAASHHLPVIDLFGLSHLAQSPLTLGGVTVNNLYALDGFHPDTVGQGLLANTILQSLDRAYDAPVDHLQLSDQQILTEAGITHPPGHAYFEIDSYVIFDRDGKQSGHRARSHHHEAADREDQFALLD